MTARPPPTPEALLARLQALPDGWPDPGEDPVRPRFRPPRRRLPDGTWAPRPGAPDRLREAVARMGAAAHPAWVAWMTRWDGGEVQGPAVSLILVQAREVGDDFEELLAEDHPGFVGIGTDGGGACLALGPGEVRWVPMGAPDRGRRVGSDFGEVVEAVIDGLDPSECPLVGA